jgi:hypothetical protein
MGARQYRAFWRRSESRDYVCLGWLFQHVLHAHVWENRWGHSAGAVSVGLHLIINSGNPGGLFQGAFMVSRIMYRLSEMTRFPLQESGIPLPLVDITAGQQYYDQLVASTNCASSKDTLACMKTVPSNTLLNAVQTIPNFASFQSLNVRSHKPISEANRIDYLVAGLATLCGWCHLYRESSGFSLTRRLC